MTERPLDIVATATAEECKDSEGNWTKWIVERLDRDQAVVYDQLRN